MEKEFGYIDKFLQNRWATHTLFWLGLFSFNVFRLVETNRPETISFSNYLAFSFYTHLALLPSQMICAYLLTYYQIPNFLYKKKYLKFFISLAISTYFLVGLARILTVYVAEPLYIENPTQESIVEILTDPLYLLIIYFPSVFSFAVLMVAVKFIKDKYQERERIELLKREKTRAELNFLKAQIHPHFLLNTLNNLYALTLKKSDKAPETVIKLSDMLVYTLYQCNEKYVPLKSEVLLLKNYISLEKLRYGDDLNIRFSENVENNDVTIAPLILLSIVENAFKHGVSGETEGAEIKIELTQIKDLFLFEVFNTKSELLQEDKTDYTKGIGVENIKKQLELVYPDRYVFEVEENKRSYKVVLKLKLKLEKDEN